MFLFKKKIKRNCRTVSKKITKIKIKSKPKGAWKKKSYKSFIDVI